MSSWGSARPVVVLMTYRSLPTALLNLSATSAEFDRRARSPTVQVSCACLTETGRKDSSPLVISREPSTYWMFEIKEEMKMMSLATWLLGSGAW